MGRPPPSFVLSAPGPSLIFIASDELAVSGLINNDSLLESEICSPEFLLYLSLPVFLSMCVCVCVCVCMCVCVCHIFPAVYLSVSLGLSI